MSLAGVLHPPPTVQGWTEWSLQNSIHHQGIEDGLRQVRGIQPPVFRLWPVTEHDFTDWLEQHQQAHNFFNQTLGLNGQDLSQLDRKDKTQMEAWTYTHFLEHLAAAKTLGLSIL